MLNCECVGVSKFHKLRRCFPNLLKVPVSHLCGRRKVMLKVDAKQGAPKDGNSPLELFQVIKFQVLVTSFLLWVKWNRRVEQNSLSPLVCVMPTFGVYMDVVNYLMLSCSSTCFLTLRLFIM